MTDFTLAISRAMNSCHECVNHKEYADKKVSKDGAIVYCTRWQKGVHHNATCDEFTLKVKSWRDKIADARAGRVAGGTLPLEIVAPLDDQDDLPF